MSLINDLVDKATGYDPSKAPPPRPPKPKPTEAETSALGEAMMAVCEAAEAWHEKNSLSTRNLLRGAVEKLQATKGWTLECP